MHNEYDEHLDLFDDYSLEDKPLLDEEEGEEAARASVLNAEQPSLDVATTATSDPTSDAEYKTGTPCGLMRCDYCLGTGKVCGVCGLNWDSCLCVEFKDGAAGKGFDPVVCDECGGTGKAA